MKYGVLLSLVSILLLIYGISSGGWWLLLLWPALSFAVVGAGYLSLGCRVFGKRADGSMSPRSIVALLPYLLYLWAVWHVIRITSREPRCNTVVEDITIGRRLLSQELPPDTGAVVDLTCEFPEPAALRTVPRYISFPLLDSETVSPEALADFAQRVARIDESLFIHCAQGHGRTALVTSLILIARGLAADPDVALRQIQAVRPAARLSRAQNNALVKAAELIDVSHRS